MNQGVHIVRNGVVEDAHLEDRKALRSLVIQHSRYLGFEDHARDGRCGPLTALFICPQESVLKVLLPD